MGKKYDAPPAPDYSKLIEQTNIQIAANERLMDKYLKFGKEALDRDTAVTNKILDVQLPAMQDEAAAAKRARDRYESEGVPFERQYLKQLQEWDTPQRREQRAGEAGADQRTAFTAAKQNEERRIEGYGLDPSQVRSASHLGSLEAMNAAQAAGAQNRARRGVEQEGIAFGGEALNIQRGLPAQTAQAYATAAGAAQTAGGQSAQNMQNGIGYYQGTQDFMRTNMGGLQGAYSVANQIYGNQIESARASAQSKASGLSSVMSLVGGAAGMMAMSDRRVKKDVEKVGKTNGLPVYEFNYKDEPSGPPRHVGLMAQDVEKKNPDAVKTIGGVKHVDYGEALKTDDYSIPDDVVRWIGEEKLSKMVEKARKNRGALKDT